MDPERWQTALAPAFRTAAVNEPIRILDGDLEIRRDKAPEAKRAPGTVWLR